ncbi:MAG: hypothetical protein ACSLFP_19125 [Acidimicrobiales bacterium]
MTPLAAHRTPVTVHAAGDTVVLEVWERLDTEAGEALVAAASAATQAGPQRLDIDLRHLESWTQEGAAALVRCREICAELPAGLHYRTGRGPGRSALLAAYT